MVVCLDEMLQVIYIIYSRFHVMISCILLNFLRNISSGFWWMEIFQSIFSRVSRRGDILEFPRQFQLPYAIISKIAWYNRFSRAIIVIILIPLFKSFLISVINYPIKIKTTILSGKFRSSTLGLNKKKKIVIILD